MFTGKKTEDLDLQKEIAALYQSMSATDKSTKEYLTMTDQLVKLYALKEDKTKRSVSPDTLFLVAGNLAGILAIVIAENKSVITSKALGFILKAR